MNAIEACRAELVTRRNLTDAAIHALDMLASTYRGQALALAEAAEPDDVKPTPKPEAVKVARRPKPASLAPAKSSPRAMILEALCDEPLTLADMAMLTKLTPKAVNNAVTRLVASGQIERCGRGIYREVSASTPKQHASTRAGEPASSGEFGTVWNGTKERNGQAPTLVAPREQKAG